jgi:hypothetical protein
VSTACQALGLPRATFYRQQKRASAPSGPKERSNAIDSFAVEVYVGKRKLGYIQKDEAPAVSGWLSDDRVVVAKVIHVARTGNFNRRVQIELTLVDMD